MSKEFMKVYHMPFKAQEIKNDNFTNFRLQFDQAFEEMTKSFSEQQDEIIANYLYEKYKDTKVSDVWVLSKPDFEKFLLEMLPKWKGKNTDIIDNYMAFKNDNSEPSEALKCLERIGAEKLARGELIRNDDKVEPYLNTIKQALLKAQEPKQYLKWEDLEFNHTPKMIDVKMSGNKYKLVVGYNVVGKNLAILRDGKKEYYFLECDKQFFNDLHLERVE